MLNLWALMFSTNERYKISIDFSFFLIRLDVAAPLCDPAFVEGSRWRISKLQWRDLVWNFGIGYPF